MKTALVITSVVVGCLAMLADRPTESIGGAALCIALAIIAASER